MKRGSSPSRRILATGAAVCLHLLALLALGWRAPQLSPPPPDIRPAVEIRLVRLAPAAPAAGVSAPPRTKPPPQTAGSPGAPTQPPPSVPAPPASGLAAGPADCEPEDLPLLTEEEKKRCRNAIDADNARRLARGAVERLAKEGARMKGAAPIDGIPADKEASYNAAAHPEPLAPHLPSVGPGVACGHVTFPLLSGVDINPDLFEKKHKQEHKPTYGHANCGGHM